MPAARPFRISNFGFPPAHPARETRAPQSGTARGGYCGAAVSAAGWVGEVVPAVRASSRRPEARSGLERSNVQRSNVQTM
jgi:hypothetical protein